MEYLMLAPFQALEKWYIEQYLRKEIRGKYPMLPLSEILQPVKERVHSQDYDPQIPLVKKIRFTDGQVFYRVAQPKSDVFLARKGDLLVSNINFEKGAFFIVDKPLIACSTDYQPYRFIREDILPAYLNLCLRSDAFLKTVAEAKPKGMKTRARWTFIKSFCIPVPDFSEQVKTVEQYQAAMDVAADALNTSWNRLSEYYVDTLQVKNYRCGPVQQYLFGLVKAKELTRWDSWTGGADLSSDAYDVVPFGSLILNKPQYGANVKGVDTPCDYRYIRITDINEDGSLNEEKKYPEKVEEAYILHENDFLIARSGNTVGKTFLYREEVGPAIFAGYLVRYVLNSNLVLPEYLLYYTKTEIFKSWILKNQRVAGQPNINGQEYLAFPVVLPPMDKQEEIVKKAREISAQIRQEQKQFCTMTEQAKQAFEHAVFG